MRADTYNGNWLSTSLELQCRPHPTGYQQLGPDQLRIEKHMDPGEIFNSESYPNIDVEKGGSIQGVIDALSRVGDMCYPEYMLQGGTLVIPGHRHIFDVAEVGYYRDMMIIIRDRVQDMIKRGMTLTTGEGRQADARL